MHAAHEQNAVQYSGLVDCTPSHELAMFVAPSFNSELTKLWRSTFITMEIIHCSCSSPMAWRLYTCIPYAYNYTHMHVTHACYVHAVIIYPHACHMWSQGYHMHVTCTCVHTHCQGSASPTFLQYQLPHLTLHGGDFGFTFILLCLELFQLQKTTLKLVSRDEPN